MSFLLKKVWGSGGRRRPPVGSRGNAPVGVRAEAEGLL